MEIAPVSDGRGLDRFIAFPYDHYRGDPLWGPQLRMDVRTLLSPKKNPFFQHAEAQYFVARSDGRTVGRIAAIKNDAHNREHRDRIGFYGFFESVDDQQVASALFDAAAAWLRLRGFDIGPTETPIVPVLIGPLETTFLFWRKLFDAGVFTNPVVPPAVPPSQCRLRTSLMATHTAEQIDLALGAFARLGKELGVV